MKLNVQIYSLIFSFIFGCIFNFVLDFFNKITSKRKIFSKIVLSLLFVIAISILYFIGLLNINNGYLHVYFLIFIMVGYFVVYLLKSFWFTHKKNNKM